MWALGRFLGAGVGAGLISTLAFVFGVSLRNGGRLLEMKVLSTEFLGLLGFFSLLGFASLALRQGMRSVNLFPEGPVRGGAVAGSLVALVYLLALFLYHRPMEMTVSQTLNRAGVDVLFFFIPVVLGAALSAHYYERMP